MLVLTRKLQETIRIGDKITVTVLRVQGRKVRIGIDAPRDVRVTRGEIEVDLDQAADVMGEDLLEIESESEATPALATAVKLAMADEPEDASDDGPATLHKVLHRRVRRDQISLPSERPAAMGRLTLRDLLPVR